jgi:hypothetical protein
MKVYIFTHHLEKNGPDKGNRIVEYSRSPQWTMPERDARIECDYFNNHTKIRVGDHCCVFSCEEQADGRFALACVSHPEPD